LNSYGWTQEQLRIGRPDLRAIMANATAGLNGYMGE